MALARFIRGERAFGGRVNSRFSLVWRDENRRPLDGTAGNMGGDPETAPRALAASRNATVGVEIPGFGRPLVLASVTLLYKVKRGFCPASRA
ncbi:MAG: hypothetical protein OXC62_05165 [Aestuariivita sp.]|nr:hypothetical protein [Aestuariivita sp.]